MFEKQAEGSDDDAQEAVDEAPIYAEEGSTTVFKQGVEIKKSPYTKVFDVSYTDNVVEKSQQVLNCDAIGQSS